MSIRLTETKLRQIIREEAQALSEGLGGPGTVGLYHGADGTATLDRSGHYRFETDIPELDAAMEQFNEALDVLHRHADTRLSMAITFRSDMPFKPGRGDTVAKIVQMAVGRVFRDRTSA